MKKINLLVLTILCAGATLIASQETETQIKAKEVIEKIKAMPLEQKLALLAQIVAAKQALPKVDTASAEEQREQLRKDIEAGRLAQRALAKIRSTPLTEKLALLAEETQDTNEQTNE